MPDQPIQRQPSAGVARGSAEYPRSTRNNDPRRADARGAANGDGAQEGLLRPAHFPSFRHVPRPDTACVTAPRHRAVAPGLLQPALIVALCGILQACALRPTLESWGLLDAPPSEPARPMPRMSAREVPPPEAHHFAVPREESVFGSLMTLQLRDGDTLPDLARHYGLGYGELAAANPGIDPWVPPGNSKVLIPMQFVLPEAPRKGIVINLAAMRLFQFPANAAGNEVVTYPVGIGREGRSTPTGPLTILRKKEHPVWYPTANIRADHSRKGDRLPAAVSPGPDNPLGDFALYLSRQPYLIHGTNKPYSIGWRASNGCIRLYPENIAQLFPAIPVREPVLIVNQPYLLGWRDGIVYLQAHRPHEELSARALQKRLRAELRAIEQRRNHRLDWAKVDQAIEAARGIPTPISAQAPGIDQVLAKAHPLEHPRRFRGQPEIPSADDAAWNVLVDETVSESTARRLAAFLNHQGPQVPARIDRNGDRYRVIAGPYASVAEARSAVKRLRIELELAGRLLEPAAANLAETGARPDRREQEAPAADEHKPNQAGAAELRGPITGICNLNRATAKTC